MHGRGLPASSLHRAGQIDAVAHHVLGGADAGAAAADADDFLGRQLHRLRHSLENPGHVAAVEGIARPAAFQHGAGQRPVGDLGSLRRSWNVWPRQAAARLG